MRTIWMLARLGLWTGGGRLRAHSLSRRNDRVRLHAAGEQASGLSRRGRKARTTRYVLADAERDQRTRQPSAEGSKGKHVKQQNANRVGMQGTGIAPVPFVFGKSDVCGGRQLGQQAEHHDA